MLLTVTSRDQMLYLRRPELSGNLSDIVCEVHGSGWLARRGAGAASKGMEGYLGDRAEGLRRAKLFQLETKLIVYYSEPAGLPTVWPLRQGYLWSYPFSRVHLHPTPPYLTLNDLL